MRESRHDGTRAAHRRHDHWDCFGRVFSRYGGGGPPRHDQVDLKTYQFGREVREPLGATIRRPIFDDQVSPFDVAELPQPLAQRGGIGGVPCPGYRLQNPDAIDLPHLLRTCPDRPRDRPTDKPNELPPLHSITWSARSSTRTHRVGLPSRPQPRCQRVPEPRHEAGSPRLASRLHFLQHLSREIVVAFVVCTPDAGDPLIAIVTVFSTLIDG